MSSRDKILAAVAANKPAATELPAVFDVHRDSNDLLASFFGVLHAIGGKGQRLQDAAVLKELLHFEGMVVNRSERSGVALTDVDENRPASEWEGLDVLIIDGGVGVAENAAIWVEESAMGHRLLPFICKQLVIVIEEKNLVPHMHEAYKRIQANGEGYGVFIAGPSKTADIEQSLVIGAHGPLGLMVYVV